MCTYMSHTKAWMAHELPARRIGPPASPIPWLLGSMTGRRPHRLAVSCYEQGKVKMQLVLPAATNAHQLPWQYALEDGAIR